MANLFGYLSDNLYVHSNTQNFIDVVNSYSLKRQYGGTNLSKGVTEQLKNERDNIGQIIQHITELCNDFYDQIGVLAHDYFNPETGIISLDGARNFSNLYLTGIDTDSKKARVTPELLSIMNSNEYKTAVRNGFNSSSTVKANSKEHKEIIEMLHGIFIYKGQLETIDLTKAKLDEIFQELTIERRRNGVALQARVFQRDIIQHLQEFSNSIKSIYGINVQDYNFSYGNQTRQFFDDLMLKFIQINIITLVDIMYKELENRVSSEKYPILYNYMNIQNFQVIFKHFFVNELQNYQDTYTLINNPSRFVGMLGEQPLLFGLSIDLNDLWTRVESLGQELETKKFKNGSEMQNVQSGSDMAIRITDFTGKEHIFRFQIKNTLTNDFFGYDSISLNSSIRVDELLTRFLDEPDVKQLEYLLFNRDYLSKYGKEHDPKKPVTVENYKDSPYRAADAPAIENLVEALMNQTLMYLVGGKVWEETNKAMGKWVPTTQNLFFIYKSRYLIPVSIFLWTAYDLINQLIIITSRGDVKTIGSFFPSVIGHLTYSRQLLDTNMGREWKTILRDKINLLTPTTLVKGQPRYPQNLVNVGAQVGDTMREVARFKKIGFSVNMHRLNSLLGFL